MVCPFCHYNPGSLTCPSCKGFKHVGICSHVLAINHILEHIDVKYLLGKVQKAKKIGGYSRLENAWNRKDWRVASIGMVAAREREGIALECTWWSEYGESVVCFRGMDWKNSRFGVK